MGGGGGPWRAALNWYARLAAPRSPPRPPYAHVAQLGEPALRRPSAALPEPLARDPALQAAVRALRDALCQYNCVGMSAPQLGLNWRMFVMQFTRKNLVGLSNNYIQSRQISLVPFTVFINPKLKILDFTKVIHSEGCESIKGFSADVPRYQAVEVSGLDENGEPITRQYEGWAARIAQHEMDHLDGRVYTDIMDSKTLHCTLWQEVNLNRGKIAMPFKPS